MIEHLHEMGLVDRRMPHLRCSQADHEMPQVPAVVEPYDMPEFVREDHMGESEEGHVFAV
jgi:hypothetical protein